MLVYAEAAAPGIPRHIGSADGGSCHCAIRGTLRLRLARTAIGKSAGKAHTDVIKDVWYDRRRNILWRWIRIMTAMQRSEEHTSELQSLMRISYAVFCLKQKKRESINNT